MASSLSFVTNQLSTNNIDWKLDEPTLKNKIKYLCLVGGLSTSEYFQERMNTEFKRKSQYNLCIIIPKLQMLSVVKGAAWFWITENYVHMWIKKKQLLVYKVLIQHISV